MVLAKEHSSKDDTFAELLTKIEAEVAPALQEDMERVTGGTHRSARKRTPYISFLLGEYELALEIGAIQEIGELPAVTPLPHIPSWIQGVTQLRGEVLSVVDLVVLFGIPRSHAAHLKKSYVVFVHDDIKFCLAVDKITGVVHVDRERDRLESPGGSKGGSIPGLASLLLGVFRAEPRVLYLLDREKMGQSPLLRNWR